MKTFTIQNNVGKSKYVVSFNDGIKTFRDGSPFFDIQIFKNKKDLNSFVKRLLFDDYIQN